METRAVVLNEGAKEALPSENDFPKWITSSGKRDFGVAIALVYLLLTFAAKKVADLDWVSNFQDLKGIVEAKWLPSLLQVVALAPIILVCARVRTPSLRMDETTVEACKQFRHAFTLLIVSWTVFYALLFFEQIGRLTGSWWEAANDFSNNFQGIFLYLCYWIMTARTLEFDDTDSHKFVRTGPSFWFVYSTLIWGNLVFLVADVALSTEYRIYFQLFSGIWVGACMGLMVGCMEGQYLGQPRKLTLMLYLYAVIQLAYVGFQNAQGSQTSDLLQWFAECTSLPLKLLFISFWYWVFENGLLAFYMMKTRMDLDDVPKQWKKFEALGG
jgi:hypothetical protein